MRLILFWSYVAVGPAVWAFVLYLMAVGRERMNRLTRDPPALPADPPTVSILIPARNEGVHLAPCLRSISKLTYPSGGRIEIIVIDDRSTDDTATVAVAHGDPRVRVISVEELPSGWLGKCHALDRGAAGATGEWLFFVDSDVELQEEALLTLLATAVERRYDAVSVLTTIKTSRFLERLMLPLLAGTWAMLFAADQTNEKSEPDKALANGQVFLIRASAYRAVGGHAAVRDRIVEDVELMRLLKAGGFATRLFAGRHLAATRMHGRLGQMFHTWARVFVGTARGSIWPMVRAILFLFLCVLSAYAAGVYAAVAYSVPVALAAGAHLVLMTVAFGLVWVWSGNSPIYALLLPLSIPVEIAILFYSIRRALAGEVEWRGVKINLRKTAATRHIDQ